MQLENASQQAFVVVVEDDIDFPKIFESAKLAVDPEWAQSDAAKYRVSLSTDEREDERSDIVSRGSETESATPSASPLELSQVGRLADIEQIILNSRDEFNEFMNKVRSGQSRQPDLFVIDLDIEGDAEAGLKILREIRKEPTLRRVPAVIFSQNTDDRVINKAVAARANSYVRKPMIDERITVYLNNILQYWLKRDSL